MGGRRRSTVGGGGGGGGGESSMINNIIMRRFRPIAPKPAGDGSNSGISPPENNNKVVLEGRAKRKYVRVTKNKQCKWKVKSKQQNKSDGEGLLAGESIYNNQNSVENPVVWLNLKLEDPVDPAPALATEERLVESWVTVECVTEMWVEGGGGWLLGVRDGERMKNLEGDTCPGFISEGFDSVRWVNEAYKKMVRGEELEGGDDRIEFRVWLVMKDDESWLGWLLYPAFSCRVRVEYTWRERKYSRTVPCDVWRMDCGGFAWRLDVRAALSLGIC